MKLEDFLVNQQGSNTLRYGAQPCKVHFLHILCWDMDLHTLAKCKPCPRGNHYLSDTHLRKSNNQ
jgi:hypothetical protein